MNQSRRPPIADSSLALLTKGYTWLPDRRRRTTAPLVRARLMGQHAVALHGPEAVRFFYDERHVERGTALPGPVLSTLFGHGAVHTLDGRDHRVRKEMFLSLLTGAEAVAGLVDRVGLVWDEAVQSWSGRRIVLFDEASRVLTRGVCHWAGVPLDDAGPLARDMVAMVDGFATPGPRHWRARRARARSEAWLGQLVEEVRAGSVTAPAGSALDAVVRHRDADSRLLDPHTAAVELINVIRPTVAVAWFVSYAGHALRSRPGIRERLKGDDLSYAVAFAHELRRFYPFAPFVGGRAVTDLEWQGEPIPSGTMVLLDVFGQNHDPALYDDPYSFEPRRFLERPPARDELIPQGGGDRAAGHRCPGEDVTIALLRALGPRLARLEYDMPEQDLRIPLNRMPTRVRSGFVIEGVRAPAPAPRVGQAAS
ncbi:cytochrome P450 [Streptomyces sp. NRRL S-455]|uniref:cytochrome P450 n=1 Tax=Streptomyces sp. NRRL S-455 TaxID=1463908 RepID=UPI0004C25B39|nr:cytochrome P450 [Streptomyces sp. NRRL S-455]